MGHLWMTYLKLFKRIPSNSAYKVLFRPFTLSLMCKSYRSSENIFKCYEVLQVSEDSDLDVVRESYLQLAKKYHPDSGTILANSHKFAQIEEAYRTIVKFKQKESQKNEDKKKATVSDIRHTAPQHRHYLNNEGVGFGLPSKREHQYQNYRVMRASENVSDYRTSKVSAGYENSMVVKNLANARKKKISSAIDRLVEDLIIESMSKGEFDDLPGKGKPLAYSGYNPMIDNTTHNLNKIMIDNGYKPEWVLLEKEIREMLQDAKSKLFSARVAAGPEPISHTRKYNWRKSIGEFCEKIDIINSMVHKLNMQVPTMNQQIMPYNAQRSMKKVLDSYNEKWRLGEIDEKVSESQDILQEYKPLDPKDRVSFKDILKEIKLLFSS